MAEIISFDTGIREYDINGAFTARFNPTDENMVAKIERIMNTFDESKDELTADGNFSAFATLDAHMREMIDDLLGAGASDALFPNINTFAISNGLPIFMNLLFAICDICADAFESEYGKTDARFTAYSKKYASMRARYHKK